MNKFLWRFKAYITFIHVWSSCLQLVNLITYMVLGGHPFNTNTNTNSLTSTLWAKSNIETRTACDVFSCVASSLQRQDDEKTSRLYIYPFDQHYARCFTGNCLHNHPTSTPLSLTTHHTLPPFNYTKLHAKSWCNAIRMIQHITTLRRH